MVTHTITEVTLVIGRYATVGVATFSKLLELKEPQMGLFFVYNKIIYIIST